jgi:hypothetical protein
VADKDKELLLAALRIRNTPELGAFKEWLADEQKLALIALVNGKEDRVMYCGQGAYIAFKRIMDLIESAPTALDKKAQPGQGRDIL